MNIGQIKQNDAGIFMGRISTLAVAMTIALKPVHSANPKAPRFEIHALTPNRTWVQVGAFFELNSNNTGEAFLNGKIEDPSLAAPLYVSAFRQEDGSYTRLFPKLPSGRPNPSSELGEAPLSNIIDPNRSVEANFRQWSVTTKSGETVTGRLEAETQTSVEILDLTGVKHVVQRKDIAKLNASLLSIMPTGFEQLPPADLAAILEYLALSSHEPKK